jgi:hypothetical protein
MCQCILLLPCIVNSHVPFQLSGVGNFTYEGLIRSAPVANGVFLFQTTCWFRFFLMFDVILAFRRPSMY